MALLLARHQPATPAQLQAVAEIVLLITADWVPTQSSLLSQATAAVLQCARLPILPASTFTFVNPSSGASHKAPSLDSNGLCPFVDGSDALFQS